MRLQGSVFSRYRPRFGELFPLKAVTGGEGYKSSKKMLTREKSSIGDRGGGWLALGERPTREKSGIVQLRP